MNIQQLRDAISKGTPIVTGAPENQFPVTPPQVPRDSWHWDDAAAKAHLPPNTVKIEVNGNQGYAFGITVKGSVFNGAIIVEDGCLQVYCTFPDLSNFKGGHETHHYGGGRICIPRDTIANAYSNFLEWTSCYLHYTR